MKKHFAVALCLVSLSVSPCFSETLYVRNKAFKGYYQRSGASYSVELKPLAAALGAHLVNNEAGGFLLSVSPVTPEQAKDVPANKLQVEGEQIDLESQNGLVCVPLDAIAKVLGAKVIANKGLQTVDVNFSSQARSGSQRTGSSSGRILTIHGKMRPAGCNQVGLFVGGSSTQPYKVGSVDGRGNYSIEIDLDRDLHPQGNSMIADMRFYREGAFESCHSACNFVVYQRGKLILQVYGGPTLPIKTMDFEYTPKP